MRNSISHPILHDFEGIRSHNPTKLPCLSPKKYIQIHIHIYMIIVLGGDSVRSFFPSRPQYAIRGTGILGQIASFERRLRGASQTPLVLRYPFRI